MCGAIVVILCHKFESFGSRKHCRSYKRRKKWEKNWHITFVYCWRHIINSEVINLCYLKFVTVSTPNRKSGTMEYFIRLKIMEHWNIGKKNGNENKRCESSNRANKLINYIAGSIEIGNETKHAQNTKSTKNILYDFIRIIYIRVEFLQSYVAIKWHAAMRRLSFHAFTHAPNTKHSYPFDDLKKGIECHAKTIWSPHMELKTKTFTGLFSNMIFLFETQIIFRWRDPEPRTRAESTLMFKRCMLTNNAKRRTFGMIWMQV